MRSARGRIGVRTPSPRLWRTTLDKMGNGSRSSRNKSFLVQFNPQVIAGRVGQILPDAEVPFRGLDGLVAEGNLDLLDWSFSFVRELRKSPAESARD